MLYKSARNCFISKRRFPNETILIRRTRRKFLAKQRRLCSLHLIRHGPISIDRNKEFQNRSTFYLFHQEKPTNRFRQYNQQIFELRRPSQRLVNRMTSSKYRFSLSSTRIYISTSFRFRRLTERKTWLPRLTILQRCEKRITSNLEENNSTLLSSLIELIYKWIITRFHVELVRSVPSQTERTNGSAGSPLENPLFPSLFNSTEKLSGTSNDQSKLELLTEQLDKRLIDEEKYQARLKICLEKVSLKSNELEKLSQTDVSSTMQPETTASAEYKKTLCSNDILIHQSVSEELNVALHETQNRIRWLENVLERARLCLK